jgi:hypothetical protein
LNADGVADEVLLGKQEVRLRGTLHDPRSADMLETSSRCSVKNQCRFLSDVAPAVSLRPSTDATG